MHTLVANDCLTEFDVDNSFISHYRSLPQPTEHDLEYTIDISPISLTMIINPPNTTILSEALLLEIILDLEYLDADDEIWRQWCELLPRDYYNTLPKRIIEKLWKLTDAPVPKSYYKTSRELGTWRSLLNLIKNTLSTDIYPLYICHVILQRIEHQRLTITEYVKIIDMKIPGIVNYDIIKNPVEMFKYPSPKYKGDVLTGYPEVFKLLSFTDNQFMPLNLFTYHVQELGWLTAGELLSNYLSKGVIQLPTPYPITQTIFKILSAVQMDGDNLLSNNGVFWDYGTISGHSQVSLAELAKEYATELLDDYSYYHCEMVKRKLFRLVIREDKCDITNEEKIKKFINNADDLDECVGEANSQFLRRYMSDVGRIKDIKLL